MREISVFLKQIHKKGGNVNWFDFSNDSYIKKWFSDYLYIKNASDKIFRTIDENGDMHYLKKGETGSLCFGMVADDNPLNGFGDWQYGMILNGPSIVDLVKLGAEWQKQQMIKDAMEGEYWDGSIYLDNRPTEYEDGNKVKIIIIKEE